MPFVFRLLFSFLLLHSFIFPVVSFMFRHSFYFNFCFVFLFAAIRTTTTACSPKRVSQRMRTSNKEGERWKERISSSGSSCDANMKKMQQSGFMWQALENLFKSKLKIWKNETKRCDGRKTPRNKWKYMCSSFHSFFPSSSFFCFRLRVWVCMEGRTLEKQRPSERVCKAYFMAGDVWHLHSHL